MTAQKKLYNRTSKKMHICVGLDTDLNKIPSHFSQTIDSVLDFNKNVIEATISKAAAYKINFAFYEVFGSKGFEIIEKTIDFIGDEVLIIADAKRGDIGNTSKKYAEALYENFKCDSVTLHPYMGFESVSPFLEYKNKLNFILGLTSNSSAEDFEKQRMQNGKYLYQEVIQKIQEWNIQNNCGVVFGATNLSELQQNISSLKNLTVLLPGVGSQGGSLEDVVKTFYSNNHQNFIVNISRSLIYSDDSRNFKKSIEEKLKSHNQTVAQLTTE